MVMMMMMMMNAVSSSSPSLHPRPRFRRNHRFLTRAQSEADASTSASTSSNSSNSEKTTATGMNLATTTPALSNKDQFVNFFRTALPYITVHKSSVFVIHIPGNVMRDKKSNVFKSVLQDIIILRELITI